MSYKFDRTFIAQQIEFPDNMSAKTPQTATVEVDACRYSGGIPEFLQNCNGSPNTLAWILACWFLFFTPIGRFIFSANMLGIFFATRRR